MTCVKARSAFAAFLSATGAGRGRLFVVRDGRLVGILSQRDLVELLSVRLDLIGGRNATPARRLWSRKRAPG